ncbi:Dos2-interacting transcription regulator of RNA-Pol-II-domain-containing protein [Helicostylum pulchrum]|nr:Dos2-interacting transcription regulator of RNA-Pol-II-domain-containing protein [Helicostylum pulchrum]
MDITQLLKNWFKSDKTEVDPSLLAYVLLYSTKNVTGVVDIVGHLVTFWKEGDPTCRTKCIELLAQVVTPSQSALDSSTINAIIQFIGERLSDPVLVPRCIDIYLVLMNTDIISSTDVIQLCNAVFSSIKVKKLPQHSRFKILTILSKALEKYANEIQRSKLNFIGGFINCMDSEKDPRNLLVAFELVRTIIDRFDISRHIEDLFEIVFCYFPISFAASSNDPFGISTDDLKDSLRKCLACTPYFAYYATPLLIEKLMSTTGSAKKDAMETISLCAPAYGAHAILPHAQDLFDALVREVYQCSDASMVDVALQTIHNVVATLGTGISIANIRDPVEKAIDSLLQQCVAELKEPELKNARSAAYILRAAASASDPACTSVTHTALPVIYQQYKSTDPSIRQKAILDILTELLLASKKLYGSVEDVGYDRDFQTPLLMYKQQILQIFILSLNETSDTILKEASLGGIHEMVLMKQFLKGEEVNIVINHLTRQLMSAEKQLRYQALTTLGVVTKLYPTVLGQLTFPVLLDELPCAENAIALPDSYRDALDAIGVLATRPAVFNIVVHPLLNKLDYACGKIGQQNIMYVHDIASTLLHIYKTASAKDGEALVVGQKVLLPSILLKCIPVAIGVPNSWYLDNKLIEVFAMIAAITTRLSTPSDQQLSINDAIKLFVDNDFSNVPSSFDQQYIENNALGIFELNKTNARIDITLLFTALIGNCCKEVKLCVAGLPAFLVKLIQTATKTSSDTRRLALSKVAASIINKWANDDIVNCVKTVSNDCLLPTIENVGDINIRRSTFVTLVWIVKSLVIKGHRYGFELLDSIIKLCGSPDLGKDAAESFVTLLQQDDLVLNKPSHATVSILFKQRVFNHCFRKLMQCSESVNILQPELQVNYLLALSHLLQNIPAQVATNEISRLMLPIIVALSSHDKNLILSMLNVAQGIVPDAQDTVVQHLGSFIHALLRLTRFQSANVRMMALDCLCSLPVKGKTETLSPFKPSVIKELSAALDDKKRIVRKNAVDCREKWYAIGK